MARKKTTTEELYPLIQRSDTGLGGGKLSFQLVCGMCQNTGDLPATKSNVHHPGFLRKAAMTFTKKGWLFTEHPVCPDCASGISN